MTFSGSKEYCVRGTCPLYLCAFAPHSLKLVEEWGSVLRTAGTYACHLHGQTFRIAVPRTWNSLPPVPEMTYTVSSGMLNPSIPYHTIPYHTNSLPLHLHLQTISRQQFQSGLKTHLFKHAYLWFYLRELLRSELTYLLIPQFISSTKEVMFSSALICLFVC